ncbi:hypothetical protein B7494_g5766 [Chlorociboria aeruginascens]|nr:hypothetical protein B7494_g5766 [Chlorociboria aeruginascens]
MVARAIEAAPSVLNTALSQAILSIKMNKRLIKYFLYLGNPALMLQEWVASNHGGSPISYIQKRVLHDPYTTAIVIPPGHPTPPGAHQPSPDVLLIVPPDHPHIVPSDRLHVDEDKRPRIGAHFGDGNIHFGNRIACFGNPRMLAVKAQQPAVEAEHFAL